MNVEILGLVREGRLLPLSRDGLGEAVNLTTIGVPEAVAPEADELDLRDAEGRLVVVRGVAGGGGWLYQSSLAEVAEPLTTAAVLSLIEDDAQAS